MYIKSKCLFIFFEKAHPDEIQILMAVVEYKTRLQKPRRGVCSTWLSRLKVAERPVVPLWVKKGTIMFPKEAVTPVILVGPGNDKTFLCLWYVGVGGINHVKEQKES